MPARNCPRCNSQIITALYAGDYVHRCNSGVTALDTEDVKRIGTREFDGVTTTEQAGVTHQVGIANTHTDPDTIRRAGRNYPRTSHGNKADTHVERQHYEYIENVDDL